MVDHRSPSGAQTSGTFDALVHHRLDPGRVRRFVTPSRKTPIAAGRRAVAALGDRRAAPNRSWLGSLTGKTAKALESVLGEADRFEELERVVHATHLAHGRSFYAQFRAPLELFALTRVLRPRHVVETGVSSGVSSLHFLLGLRANGGGNLHSVDFPTRQKGPTLGPNESPVALPPGLEPGWAVPEEYRDRWDLRIGRSQDLLPDLVEELPSVDLFLHDSHHTPAHLAFELEAIRPKLSPGAVVLADNTVWTGDAFPQFARELGVRVARRGRSDLVGLRMPAERAASRPARATTPSRGRRSRSSR